MKEPRIVQAKKGMLVAGLTARVTMRNVYRELPKLYARYLGLKAEGKVANLKSPWEYVSLSDAFSGIDSWDYHTGYMVTSAEGQYEGLELFYVPEGSYAVFELRCRSKLLFGMMMGRLKRYIYRSWLPGSGYVFSGCEFEYSNQSMACPFDIDLHVGIRRA
jgi:predicted transcriptional regulator YdeE